MLKPSLVSGIIVLAVAGYFGYHTVHVRLRQERARILEQLKEAQQEQDQRIYVSSLLRTLEDTRRQFASKPDPDWLLQEVGRIADEADVQALSLTPQMPREGEGFSHIAVSLQFSSTYHQLGHFLSRIESAPYVIRVDDLTISKEPHQHGLAKVHLVLSTLYVPPVIAAAGGR